MDQLPGPDRNPDLLSFAGLEADARGFPRLGILERDLRDVQRRLGADDAALRPRLRRLGVAGVDIDPETTTLPSFGIDLMTSPWRPLSLPLRMTTLSPFLIFAAAITAPPARG
jgi:hypothetical protein